MNQPDHDKPLVQYDATMEHTIHKGRPALVWPIDHPDSLRVSNTRLVSTSTVLFYDRDTGVFETLNTRYVPQEPRV